MMFNQDGGMVISKKGNVVREWMWPSKGKLDDPVEIWVLLHFIIIMDISYAVIIIYFGFLKYTVEEKRIERIELFSLAVYTSQLI